MCKYKWFQHKECEYFPCHSNVDINNFNCLFCYCPLYIMDDCGGNYHILPNGVKDCSNCTIPHDKDMYDYIVAKIINVNKSQEKNS